jgi:hypothetical protein
MVIGTSVSSTGNTTTVTYKTLADSGIESMFGQITADDEAKGETTLVCKDADTAKNVASALEKGLAQMIEATTNFAEKEKSFASLVEALKSVKTETKDEKVVLKGQASGEALVNAVKALFMVRAPEDRGA